ncbi:hypothetical protein EV363DRAFT_1323244 [Boletus edulis]|nr:hypothetical protein EV363DRAFT_1323244 [Boletus edulis]
MRIVASFTTYRPIPLPESPTYIAFEDVTNIVPAIDAGGKECKEAPHDRLVGKPKKILVIVDVEGDRSVRNAMLTRDDGYHRVGGLRCCSICLRFWRIKRWSNYLAASSSHG